MQDLGCTIYDCMTRECGVVMITEFTDAIAARLKMEAAIEFTMYDVRFTIA
jgi:hypothetical protein